jgi:hypothetical protein
MGTISHRSRGIRNEGTGIDSKSKESEDKRKSK